MLLVLVGLVLTLALLAGGTLGWVGLFARQEQTTSFAVAGEVRHIVVRVGSGRVTVRGSDRADVGIERTVTRGLQTPSFHEVVDGDTLRLDGACPGVDLGPCSVAYTVDVPRSGSLDIDSGPASIEAGGILGGAKLRSNGGSLRVYNLGGDVDLSTSTGSISGSDLAATTVRVSASSGGVRLGFTAPPQQVEVHTGVGSIDVEVPPDQEPYAVSANGLRTRVEVAAAPDGSRAITATTGAGSIRIHYPDR